MSAPLELVPPESLFPPPPPELELKDRVVWLPHEEEELVLLKLEEVFVRGKEVCVVVVVLEFRLKAVLFVAPVKP
jgi:hypothetical protein